MNSYEIVFALTPQEKIIASLKDPLEFIGWDDAEPIIFSYQNNIIVIANGPTYFNIRDLRDFLKKVLNNELLLHKSITEDIGYLVNEYHKNETGFIIERFENGFEAWVGYKYLLWYARANDEAYETWLYNDHNKNIIFEITPAYPYFYCDKKEEPNYVTYKKWIKIYKPYFKSIVPRNIAQFWLEQAEFIVNAIDNNIIRWEKEQELKT